MTHEDIVKAREQFLNDLRQTAAYRAIPIDRLNCRGIPDKDGFELIVESGGKERILTVSDFESIKDRKGQIEFIINLIIDNE